MINKYRLAIYQPIYHDGEFSHNVQRVVLAYGENQTSVVRHFEYLRRGERIYHIGDKMITVNRENLMHIEWLGKVEFDCFVTFLDDVGRIFEVTNTVEAAVTAARWIINVIESDTKTYPDRKVVSTGIKEVLSML